jgi:hypothetical protein
MPEMDGSICRTGFEPGNARPDSDRAPNREDAETRKRLVHYTFDDTGDASIGALRQSNSEPSADALFAATGREMRCGSSRSFAGLEAHMRLGGHLSELKKILPHGSFGRGVKDRLGIERQWGARLMQLHEESLDVLKAIEWAKSENCLSRSEFSVDGALRLLTKWRRGLDNEDVAAAASKIFSDDGFVSNEKIKKPDFIYYLKLFAFVLLWEIERQRKLIALLEAARRDDADARCPHQFKPLLPKACNDTA